jgi:hypothetical protein
LSRRDLLGFLLLGGKRGGSEGAWIVNRVVAATPRPVGFTCMPLGFRQTVPLLGDLIGMPTQQGSTIVGIVYGSP